MAGLKQGQNYHLVSDGEYDKDDDERKDDDEGKGGGNNDKR